MLRSLFISFCLLLPQLSFAQTADESVRNYADSIAKLVVDKSDDALYEQFAPSLRSTYSREDLMRPLPIIREKHGEISSYEYRQRIQGQTSFSGRLVSHLTYWYAVETQKKTPQAFLLIKVIEEGKRVYVAGIDFNEIIGPVPPYLQLRKK